MMIAAIVVFYYPDFKRAENLLSSLVGEVDAVFGIDNTPGSSSAKPEFLERYEGFVSYIPLGENRGIAEAQNIGIELSITHGYSHVLLLDQDSFLLPGMVTKLLNAEQKLLMRGENLGAMSPHIVERNTGKRPCAVRYRRFGVLSVKKVYRDVTATEPEQTDNFIASGSLMRTDTIKALGAMRSDLFIEYVDTEWALRAHTAGYRSYCVPDAVMEHSFGEAAKTILGKEIYLYGDLRYYYKMRNSAYLVGLATMGWRWRMYNLSRIPYHLLVYSAFSRNRLRTFCLLLRAIRDGLKGKLGPVTLQP
jgi:rhamnosyltransferase